MLRQRASVGPADYKECNLANSPPQVRYRRVDDDDDGMRLDNFLLRELDGVPRSHVYRIIRSGEVRIDRGRAKPATRLHSGSQVRIPPVRQSRREGDARPPDGLIERVGASIHYEAGDWLALNKPPGLAVHAGSGQRFGLIEALRAARSDAKLELVHRLDRDTSGILLVARGRGATNRLRAALADEHTEKCYLTLLAGAWRAGPLDIDAPLVRDVQRSGERMVEVASTAAGARHALSHFAPLQVLDSPLAASLMRVRIRTGRTHQIRVHARHAGHPVGGDEKYGERAFNRACRAHGLRRMFLHAGELDLPGLDGGVCLRAPLPDDLSGVLAALGAEPPH